ncbi:tetratricopeptide repeat protein [Paraburkholderia sp. EG287A]|uniref:tetratricopeptide repeat protein n=1 Tax=unclassified Paraburkholderia TaxID=2615204 RepID=UPI0034D1B69C
MNIYFRVIGIWLACYVNLLTGTAVAGVNSPFIISGNFEGGIASGKFIYTVDSSGMGLKIRYYSPSIGKTIDYKVSKYDKCSAMVLYAIQDTNRVVIDGSCPGQGGQIYKNVYAWNANQKNWCLIREIIGEKADVSSGAVVSSERVSRVKGCATIGDVGAFTYESPSEVASEISREIRKFKGAKQNRDSLRIFLREMQDYDVSEISGHLSRENVGDINDLAFYLSRNGRSYEAIQVLETIVSDFPDRVVAKLNLADAYWDNSFKEKAKNLYRRYSEQMTVLNLGNEIPQRVWERIK